ncbi:hypothetical protein A0H81_12313 [Grifola frondosa]|uniref:Uncharacterized protein n=1 Tax=Grifola frondosa TaxID=5627 RepID=A0A1C7LTV0_GRIFR|nr:hypothetical protein A0H81_12313 [Grifola frondosa]
MFGPGILASTGESNSGHSTHISFISAIQHTRDMVPIFHEVSYKIRRVSPVTVVPHIKSDPALAAMNKVGRAHYVLWKDEAYQDSPQPIGYDATISAPHMVRISPLSTGPAYRP